MSTHHEWLRGHLEPMRDTHQPSNRAVERLRKLAGPGVPDDAVRDEVATLERTEKELRDRAHARMRRKVIAALGGCYRKGVAPGSALSHVEPHEVEFHSRSDYAHRAKYGGAFTAF